MAVWKNIIVYERPGQKLADYLLKRKPHLNINVKNKKNISVYDIKKAEILLSFSFPELYKPDNPGDLRWVHSIGAGVDSFLFKKSWPDNLLLTRTTGLFDIKIAEYCISKALFHLQKNRKLLDNQTRHIWERLPANLLNNSNILIAGTGFIGSKIARLFKTFDCKTTGFSFSGKKKKYFDKIIKKNNLSENLANADFLIIALPLTKETELLLDRNILKNCKNTYLINIARGRIIEEDYITEAIEKKHLSGAALDVFNTEPLPASSPLWNHPDILITPHIAAVTSIEEAGNSFLECHDFLEKGKIPHLKVNTTRGY